MRYVRYVGLAHQRQISAAEWQRAGAPGESVTWSAFNGFSVPLDRFTEDQIRIAIDPDDSFVISGEGQDQDTEFKPDLTARHDMTPEQLENRAPAVLDVERVENASTVGSEASMAAPGDGSAPVSRKPKA